MDLLEVTQSRSAAWGLREWRIEEGAGFWGSKTLMTDLFVTEGEPKSPEWKEWRNCLEPALRALQSRCPHRGCMGQPWAPETLLQPVGL